MISLTLRPPLHTKKERPVPTGYETGSVAEWIWTLRTQTSVPVPGNESLSWVVKSITWTKLQILCNTSVYYRHQSGVGRFALLCAEHRSDSLLKK